MGTESTGDQAKLVESASSCESGTTAGYTDAFNLVTNLGPSNLAATTTAQSALKLVYHGSYKVCYKLMNTNTFRQIGGLLVVYPFVGLSGTGENANWDDTPTVKQKCRDHSKLVD